MRKSCNQSAVFRPPQTHGVTVAASTGAFMPEFADQAVRVATAGDPLTVRTEGDLVDMTAIVDHSQSRTVGSPPIADRRIIPARDNKLAVGTVVQANAGLLVAG